MKALKTAIIFIIGMMFGISYIKITSMTNPIYDPTVSYLTGRWIGKVGGYLPNEYWAHSEVRKNITNDVRAWREISRDPSEIYVIKQYGDPAWIIQIKNTQGRRVELWVDANNKLEEIQEITY